MMTAAQSRITFYAFRYCLGRMTYAVSDFCEFATAYIKEILTDDLALMDKEITEAQEHDDAEPKIIKSVMGKRLGMDCDRADWLKLRRVIRVELKRRNNTKGDQTEK